MIKLLTLALVFIVLGVGVYFAVTQNLIPLGKIRTSSQATTTQVAQPTNTPKIAEKTMPVPTVTVEDDLTALERDLNSLSTEDALLTQDIDSL